MSTILRPAVAMIELIFALVIMGLVLMSAPQLISIAAKSGYVTIQQEAINEAASQVNMVMGYYWDEAITDDTYAPSVLSVSQGNSDLDETNTSGYRKGVPKLSKRSFVRSDGSRLSATVPASLGPEGGDRDDIDDFKGDTNLTLIALSPADYVEGDTIKIHTDITYISDTPAGGDFTPDGVHTIWFSPNLSSSSTGTTNIKRITVTLTSTAGIEELNKTIKLNAFSCNIGSTEFEEKTF